MNRIGDEIELRFSSKGDSSAVDSKFSITSNPLIPTDTSSVKNDVTVDYTSEERLLSTPFNQTILLFYTTFTIVGTAACAAAGLTVYNAKYGLSLNVVTGIALLGSYVHYFSQFAIGYMGDKVSFGSFGRKKPFVMIGYLGQCTCVFFLFFAEYFVNISSNSAIVIWYFIFQMLYEVFNAIIIIPYQTWLIEAACNNNDYMRVQTTSIPIGVMIGGIVGLLLQLNGRTHLLFYLYAIGGLFTTIAICYFIPSKELTVVPAQPAYIPSFQTCIRMREFKLVFIMTFLTNLTYNIFGNGSSYLMSCSYFDFVQIEGGLDDAAVKSRHLYAWIVGFWLPSLLLFFSVVANLLLGYLLQFYDKIRLFQIFITLFGFFILVSLTTTFSKDNVGFVFYIIMCSLPYICYQALTTLQGIFLRDLITVDNLIYSLHRENMYFTAMTVPSSLLYLLIGNLFPTIENYTGYGTSSGGSVTCSSTFPWNLRLVIVISSFVCIPAYLATLYYPLSTAISLKLATALQLKEKDETQQLKEKNEPHQHETNTLSSDIQHMSTAEIFDISTEPSRLGKIFMRNICTNVLIITAIVLLFAGLLHQLVMPSSRSLQLLVSSLSFAFMIFLYEFFRTIAMYKVYRQPSEVIKQASEKEFKRLVSLTNDLQETINKYCHIENYLEAGRLAHTIDDYNSKYNIYGINFSKSGVYYMLLLLLLTVMIVLGSLASE